MTVKDYDRKDVIKKAPESLGLVGRGLCGETLAYAYQVSPKTFAYITLNQDGSWKAEKVSIR